MKKIKIILLLCLISPLGSYCQTLWAASDYRCTDGVRFRNLIDSSNTIRDPDDQPMYYYYDTLGDIIITNGPEYFRKMLLGVRTLQSFIDSCEKNGIRFGPYNILMEIDEKILEPGDVDPKLLAGSPSQDSITRYPYDDRMFLCRDSLLLYERYPAEMGLGETLINVRHIRSDYVPTISRRLGFRKVLPVGIAVYQIQIDTIIIPIYYYHLYFKKPGLTIRYKAPCMFKKVVDFEKSTTNTDGGSGQYVYYDELGYPRVISHLTYEMYRDTGVRELKEVYKEWKARQ